MFHTVINSLSNVLAGAHRPCMHAIAGPIIKHLGSKIHVGITNQVRLQFKLIVDIFEHGHSIVMNKEYDFGISQDVGVVAITVNVNFGLRGYFGSIILLEIWGHVNKVN